MAEIEQRTLAESLNLQSFIGDLVGDLKALRENRISVREVRARADLARQVLRGVHYVVLAQKFIEGRLPPPERAKRSKS